MSDKTQDDMVTCIICGRIVKGRVPKGGDGSALAPYPHKPRVFNSKGLEYCSGARLVREEP